MNHPVRTRPDPDEVRARILEVAEQHCRRIGYHKTSVADIACELGMSPANVYRFFPSRAAINESICGRIVNEVADIAFAIARTNAPALEKLDRLLTAVHRHNKTKLIKGAGGAKSVFHFDVQGSVAKSTHAGIPWLRVIREKLGPRVHFWPFDGWDIPGGRSAIAEVYPALWSRSFANEGRTGDQHDAFSIAAWLSRADRDGTLAAFLNPDLSPPERTLAQVEGWILGVSGLIRADKGRDDSGPSTTCKPVMFRLH